MPNRRKKVLFIAEAVTLAHVGRMLSLAQALPTERYETQVACDPRYAKAIGTTSVALQDIHTIPSQQFFNALDKGQPIYQAQDLIQYVEEDRKLLQAYKPDVVVGDFRLSLAASARLENIPYLSVTNAYWSPYANIRYLVPDIPLTRMLGVPLAQICFDCFRPIAFAQHAKPINRMLAHFGLPQSQRDLRMAYTLADYTLYSDLPQLVSTHNLPNHHRFIGPVQWAPNVPTPRWWDDIPIDKPIVYVNLGSSGHGRLLPEVLDTLDGMPVTVIAATAGRVELKHLASNEFVADFLPGDQAVKLASLVICNGGSPTCYQALAAGRPIIGLPINLDQYLNMSLVQAAGVGTLIRSGKHTTREIAATAQHILQSPSFAAKATALQQHIAQSNPAQALIDLIESL
ncbi:UDP:flavonoid glycosyltransferase YjiC (YdhE family) [Chitinivorax tropicus]|uniref:UDP:flavonoid glycosyltransferase YjiC (YdhE family) n=1 Tax=Chitinivorax tropicus TaxID=714531 RepID=A0A840MDF8_9PROT|nr:glycosyltransferase [Chitinivorax tropicus]MBB5017344.1 UDP:flavonoid glycosyltransferase YjiC (YdhE family) [Chitinivorax tropicus]